MKTIRQLPSNFKQLVVTKFSTDFRDATKVVSAAMPTKLNAGQVLIRNIYVGINATDMNLSAGRHGEEYQPPFVSGFESIAEVVAVPESGYTGKVALGAIVCSQTAGANSEYQVVDAANLLLIPQYKGADASKTEIDPAYVSLMISGLTASIAIDEIAKPKKGDVALVTAASGGTGQFAVQLFKQAGCKVIGTCGSSDKVDYLKQLGVDRVIDYKHEDLDKVLEKEYSNGVNIAYEAVGGKMLASAIKNIAEKGKVITIGGIFGYKDGSFFDAEKNQQSMGVNIPVEMLSRSASLNGFLIFLYPEHIPKHFNMLAEMYHSGKLKIKTDKVLKGLETVADGVEYLHSGKSLGKIVVKL